MGKAEFRHFMQLSSQLVTAAEKFVRDENLSPVMLPKKSKDMAEQLNLAHKVADVVDRANTKNCVTLLRYNVEKPEIFYAPVRLFVRRRRTKSFNKMSM